ncbi:hypothetical protein F5884DRAFT_893063 [Xylogone sp. PMI_703]|nr:hypothetical protein F5884DRAFT_893063 [Xylogone sp. PMI_703]
MAYIMPAGLTDGTYRVQLNESGYEVHHKITGPNEADWTLVDIFKAKKSNHLTSRHETSRLVSRASVDCPDSGSGISSDVGCFYTYCGCGNLLNHGECDQATEGLRAQAALDKPIPWLAADYVIVGGTVVFACNNGMWDTLPAQDAHFFNTVLGATLGIIDKHCGRYVAGASGYEDAFIDWKYPVVGHAQYLPGDDFCEMASSSPAGEC